MSKIYLSGPDYSDEFRVVVISSQLPDFKQCLQINHVLGINLRKRDDLLVYIPDTKLPDLYSIYIDHIDERTVYYFLRNNNLGDSFAPVSYLLVSNPLPDGSFRELLTNIRHIEGIFDATELSLIKSKTGSAMMKRRQEIFGILAEMELYLIEQGQKEDREAGRDKWKKPRKRP